ncbi:MAG: 4-hydroxy-3-methylbut-2-enyl diphosphate reductase [Flavobacteriales bacterium]|nr:4-hydroxy-3-methylbut-2-enyl diphosphate reductase [Flavobacteriales bacterium]
MKQFDIPTYYRSGFITGLKRMRNARDRMKTDLDPTVLNFGNVRIMLARHFGFCYGVENAIEISYRALDENPGKRLFLLSQMIHNPHVNDDLQGRGIQFLMDTAGNRLMDWKTLTPDDVVIVPAFGTTLEIEAELAHLGVSLKQYNTTCPFVEKVWKRSARLGTDGYTIVIHGKHDHEETRATFSHAKEDAPAVVVRDMKEAQAFAKYVSGQSPAEDFYREFEGRFSDGFDVALHLQRIGVVNQTTMLATETQAIADYLREVVQQRDGSADHFADTRDTLCYATNDNQRATLALLEHNADLALVIGGFNSSNTSHIVELCEEKLPTYFIGSASDLTDQNRISHWNIHTHQLEETTNFLPAQRPLTIVVTSGASCPDSLVESVIARLLEMLHAEVPIEEAVEQARQHWEAS